MDGLYTDPDLWHGFSCMYFAMPNSSNSLAEFRVESWDPKEAPILLYHFFKEKSIGKISMFLCICKRLNVI